MNLQIVAILISEGAKVFGQWFRNRPISIEYTSPVTNDTPQPITPTTDDAPQPVAVGCIPCAIGHLGTCNGLLSEAMRFARTDGMSSNEVLDRTGKCLDELNAMERVDLSAEKLVTLPEWERELADKVLIVSRQTRHSLETIGDVTSLEEATAQTSRLRTEIWRDWAKLKMAHLTPEEKQKIQERINEKIDEIGDSAPH